AATGVPMILSTGMAGDRELEEAIDTITRHHNRISILHCVSQYPTEPRNVNLHTITYLKKKYPEYTIGYSDHTIGISTPVAAVALGDKVIEKDLTLDRRMEGTDQAGTLGPDGINRMVRDIRLLEQSLGEEKIFIADGVQGAKEKLERSIATKTDLKAGEVIALEKIHLLSPGDGIKWSDRDQLLGKKLLVDLPRNEIIYPDLVEL